MHADGHAPRHADDGAVARGADREADRHRLRRTEPLEPARVARRRARAPGISVPAMPTEGEPAAHESWRDAAGRRELAAMSFWEDRFVNRPHAGAALSPYMDVQGSAYPHLRLRTSPPGAPPRSRRVRGLAAGRRGREPGRARRSRAGRCRRRVGRRFRGRRGRVLRRRDRGRGRAGRAAAPVFFRRRKPAVPEDEVEESRSRKRRRTPTRRRSWSTRLEHRLEPRARVLVRGRARRGAGRREEARLLRTPARRGDVVETEHEDAPETESDGSPWHITSSEDDEDAVEELAARPRSSRSPSRKRKRGLFRRRKSEPVEETVVDAEDAEPSRTTPSRT